MTLSPQAYGAGYGLTITTALPLPGLAALDTEPTKAPDISIDRAALPTLTDGSVNGPYRLTDDGLLFTARGVGRYLARDGETLLVDADPAADQQAVSELLIATALPMLLWQRGGVLLHAACVLLPGQDGAIALAGASGSGKSTLAAALVKAGAALVADDSCWLRTDGIMVMASGLPGGLFRRTGIGDARVFVPVSADQQVTHSPLVAVFVLGQPCAAPMRLTAPQALEAMLRHRHRPRIPAILGQEAAQFIACALHSQHIPTYGLPSKDDEQCGSLLGIIDFILNR